MTSGGSNVEWRSGLALFAHMWTAVDFLQWIMMAYWCWLLEDIKQNNPEILKGLCLWLFWLWFQAKTGRSPSPGRDYTGAVRAAQEGWGGAGCHLPHLPQDEVRGRCWPHLQLLQHTVLCAVRRKGYPSFDQGTTTRNYILGPPASQKMWIIWYFISPDKTHTTVPVFQRLRSWRY